MEWIYVDFLVKLNQKESDYYHADWPYHAVQVHGSAHYGSPPFKLTSRFRKALKEAVKSYGEDKIKNASRDAPTRGFLDKIAAAYT